MHEFLTIPWFKLQPWTVVGDLKIQPFGVLVATGILIGTRVAEWHGERRGIPRQATADVLLYTIMIGLGSAMLLNMVFYEPEKLAGYFRGDFTYPGLSSYGGFFGAFMAAIYFRQKRGLSLLRLSDAAFAFPVAWFFGRMGCFTVHDHPGIPSDFFLAVENYNGHGVARHDLGLYEVIWCVGAFAILWVVGNHKSMKPGYTMALVFVLYAPIRFFLDFLRETKDAGGDVRYGDLTPGQYWSFMMVATAIGIYLYARHHPTPELYLHGAPPPDEHADEAKHAAAEGPTDRKKKKKKAKPKPKRRKK